MPWTAHQRNCSAHSSHMRRHSLCNSPIGQAYPDHQGSAPLSRLCQSWSVLSAWELGTSATCTATAYTYSCAAYMYVHVCTCIYMYVLSALYHAINTWCIRITSHGTCCIYTVVKHTRLWKNCTHTPTAVHAQYPHALRTHTCAGIVSTERDLHCTVHVAHVFNFILILQVWNVLHATVLMHWDSEHLSRSSKALNVQSINPIWNLAEQVPISHTLLCKR